MPEQAANMLQLPSREARVEMALARMGSTGIRAVGIDHVTLVGLCVRLSDPMVKDIDAWRWLNEQLGGTADEEVVDDNVVYRFRGRFLPYFAQATREQVLRASRLAVEQVAEADDLTPLNRQLLSERVAGRLLDGGEDVSAAELSRLAAIVRDSERNDFEQQDQERKDRDLERRAVESEAKLAALEADTASKKARVEERLKAAEKRVDDLAKVAKSGGQIDPSVFAAIREELAGARGEAA